MVLSILLLLSLQIPEEAQLRQRVEAFWQALARRDTVSALEYVKPESRNTFLNRNRLPFTDWELVEIKPRGDSEVSVTIRVRKMPAGVPGNFEVVTGNNWVFDGTQWMALFREPNVEDYRSLFSSSKSAAEPSEGALLPPRLQILPDVVKFAFLSHTRISTLVIRNGFSQPVRLLQVEVDRQRFEIVEKPDQISSGDSAHLKLKYTGEENEKELKSEVILHFEQEGETIVIKRPILYNHLSPATRALFGLTDEKARMLRRGDPLKPVLPRPKPPQQPDEIPPR